MLIGADLIIVCRASMLKGTSRIVLIRVVTVSRTSQMTH